MRSFRVAGVTSLLIGALALPTECLAAQWVTNITVAQVVAGSSAGEYAQLLVSGTVVNPAGCAATDSYIVHDAALVRDALAIGMTALASGLQIRIYVTDTCDAATGRPLVTSIGLM
jgi:hypothetical protein